MGGPGSGWPIWKVRRATTESSLALDVRRLSRDHARFTQASQSIRTWRDPNTQEPVASIAVRITATLGCAPKLVLGYTTDRGEDSSGVVSVVGLDKTLPHFGGVRWWFICPSCKRRAAILYARFGREGFLCRRCHGLTYQSSQDSHRFDRLFFSIGGSRGNDVRRALVRRFKKSSGHSA
jgi:hypothetical protein